MKFHLVSIANAGDARSYAFQALDAAKSGNFDEAEELLKKSEEASTLAHKAQTDLLFDEVNGNPTPVNVTSCSLSGPSNDKHARYRAN